MGSYPVRSAVVATIVLGPIDHTVTATTQRHSALLPGGCVEGLVELVGLRAEAKDYEQVANHLRALGIQPDDLMLTQGDADRLVLYLSTPKGVVSL